MIIRGFYGGRNGEAVKGSKIYIGNGENKATVVKAGYIGVEGISRQFWPNVYQKQTFTIIGNYPALELRAWLINAGWDGVSPVEVTIATGSIMYARNTGEYAMLIRGQFPNGIRLINRGTISGFGGRGGDGGYAGAGAWQVCGPGQPGAPGGNALYVGTNVTIYNAGYIGGGGGGGAAAYGEQGSGYTESGGGSGGGRISVWFPRSPGWH